MPSVTAFTRCVPIAAAHFSISLISCLWQSKADFLGARVFCGPPHFFLADNNHVLSWFTGQDMMQCRHESAAASSAPFVCCSWLPYLLYSIGLPAFSVFLLCFRCLWWLSSPSVTWRKADNGACCLTASQVTIRRNCPKCWIIMKARAVRFKRLMKPCSFDFWQSLTETGVAIG